MCAVHMDALASPAGQRTGSRTPSTTAKSATRGSRTARMYESLANSAVLSHLAACALCVCVCVCPDAGTHLHSIHRPSDGMRMALNTKPRWQKTWLRSAETSEISNSTPLSPYLAHTHNTTHRHTHTQFVIADATRKWQTRIWLWNWRRSRRPLCSRTRRTCKQVARPIVWSALS